MAYIVRSWLLALQPLLLLLPSLLLLLLPLLITRAEAEPVVVDWGKFVTPSADSPQVIGSYSSGCVAGTRALAPSGTGYQVMRLSRSRFYGHPHLINYLEQLGELVAEQNLPPLLIGDLSQARGGPMTSGHRSHQTGLDADIWFYSPPAASNRTLHLSERETLSARSVVDVKNSRLDNTVWQPSMAKLIQLAAQSARVERIFVHPVIKKHLCQTSPGNTSWLKKLRPWWGHYDHLHVRLKCPTNNSQCQRQAPVPPGNGCDSSLDWWFSEEFKHEMERRRKEKKPPPEIILPQACQLLAAD